MPMVKAAQPKPLKGELMKVFMGPQHPSTHGVLQVQLETDGEVVHRAVPNIGFLHRCKEKIGESVEYHAYVPYTDRMDYLAAMNTNWTWSMAVEKLCGIEVPERAEYIRLFAGELNRIASHLVFLASFGLDMGAWTPLLHCFRDREQVLDILEELSGGRLCFGYIQIGGVHADITPRAIELAKKFLKEFPAKIDSLNQLLSYNHIFIKRTADVAVISPEKAIANGITGPMLRASGVDFDLRRDHPYSIYDRFDFKVPIGTGVRGTVGDCWNRYYQRVLEMYESVRILEQVIEGFPEGGEFRAKVKPRLKPPKGGEVYVRAECPRGEVAFYMISDGSNKPYRMKVRGPSFCNLSILEEISRNVYIADLVAMVGSIDLVLGEVDR